MTERRRVPVGNQGKPQRFDFGTKPTGRRLPPAETEEFEEGPGCDCPVLDHEDWDGVESDWTDIAFIKTMSNAVLGVPVGFAGLREELFRKAKSQGFTVPDDPMLLLGAGKFRRPVMLEVEAGPGDRGVERPGGIVFTRILNAPWGEMARNLEETRAAALERYGRAPDSMWVWYLTCRACSAQRGFETLFVAHYRERE